MASVTHTMSQLQAAVPANHDQINVAASHISWCTTFCPSSVLNMVQVPHGATLLDFTVTIFTGSPAQNLKIGTSATKSGIMSITTLSVTLSFSGSLATDVLVFSFYGEGDRGYIKCPGGTRGVRDGTKDLMPVRISLSDNAMPQRVWVQGKLGAGISATGFATFVLFYAMDGMAGRTTIR